MGQINNSLIIFDFDGTLANSKKLYVYAIHKFLSKHNISASNKKIEKSLGPRLDILINKFCSNKKDSLAIQKEINSFITKKALLIKPAPYAKETLKRLSKEHILVLVTNSVESFIARFLKKYSLRKYFKNIYCAKFRKKEQGFRYIFRKHKVKAENSFYVADLKDDVKIAKKAGCKIKIILLKSWHIRKFSGKEKYAVKSLKELRF